MLASHLGVKDFLKGVSIYLKKHTYGNAKTTALFDALSEASGKDVNALMKPWIEKIGFPVLNVSDKPGQITISQSRFLSTGDVKPEEDETTWWTPLAFKGTINERGGEAMTDLTTKDSTIFLKDDDFWLINKDATGFYRVNYPTAHLTRLGKQLGRLSTEDKIYITGSSADMAFAGYGTTPSMLSFIHGLNKETHYRVLSQALDSINLVKSVFGEDETIKKGMNAFSLRLIDTALNKIGWDVPKGEDYNTSLLRKKLFLSAVGSGHPG